MDINISCAKPGDLVLYNPKLKKVGLVINVESKTLFDSTDAVLTILPTGESATVFRLLSGVKRISR